MTLSLFTLVHILISLVGIAAGFGMLSGMLAAKILPRWIAVFLSATMATSVTGFFFPFTGITPGIVVGIISVIALSFAIGSLYIKRLAGKWRVAFAVTAILSLYLNVFVLIAQLFQKTPALANLSPGPAGPPFAITQSIVLIVFVILGIIAARKTFETSGT